MKAVILAAGVGSRLGRPFPKSLSVLPDGERILGRQIRILQEARIKEIYIVVGFKKTLLMEEYPQAFFCYNPVYYITNTSKSLLAAIERFDDDVLWVNGDVVFDPEVISEMLKADGNIIAVDKKRCAEEEVKYSLREDGTIREISKIVAHPQGEAVGVNLVRKESLQHFVEALRRCDDQDYFEKGIEIMIQEDAQFRPVDISRYRCIEVDFAEDWQEAVRLFSK
ncbi:NTP transferase domain-containing protein [Oleidesulfovibrio sp.]|uniref:phosphocholine cytidylyltransferase family protein n=1 Tax=Oleidesulfovibrio sp. TaxID=2909707 RepID=UPI003A83D4B0